jgi:hypothetical protein
MVSSNTPSNRPQSNRFSTNSRKTRTNPPIVDEQPSLSDLNRINYSFIEVNYMTF